MRWLLFVLTLATAVLPVPSPGHDAVLVKATPRDFANPHDLVLSPDGRYLYVADVGNNVVRVLEPDSLVSLGIIGAGELSAPHDVTFDRLGRLLVADSGNDRIVIFDVQGATGRRVSELRGGLDSPEGVAVDADGRVYVTSAGSHNVSVFENGKLAARAGRHGRSPGAYIRPHDLDIAASGDLYIADPGNNRLQAADRNLQTLRVLEGSGFRFREPKYIAFDEHDRLYVADEHNNQVKIFDARRRPFATISGGLNRPEGVTARGGRVWVSDTYNNRILLYRLEAAP